MKIIITKFVCINTTGITVRDLTFVFPVDCSTVVLTPTEEECEKVVEKLKQSIKNISDCEFEPSYDENACKYCAYKDFCGMEIV